jgi:hypothetical protein
VGTPQVRSHADQSTPVLRTGDGDRVYDAGDIVALVALGEIAGILDFARQQRLQHETYGYVSAAAHHLLNHGHRLAFGCCSPETRAALRRGRSAERASSELPYYTRD